MKEQCIVLIMIYNDLRRETQRTKERQLKGECDNIEDQEKREQYDMMYRMIRKYTWDKEKGRSRMRDIQGKDDKTMCEWKE